MSENQDSTRQPRKETGSLRESGSISLAKITALQAIAVAAITVIGSGLTGYFGYKAAVKKETPPDIRPALTIVPPPTNVKEVPKLEESSVEGIQTLRDISIFDLRAWKQVPASEINNRFSPVNYINYLHVKKTRPVSLYRAHYGTSGAAIDLRCITHEASILQQVTPVEHAGTKDKEYAVEVNVESMPIDKEFLIVIEGTYWNSFQNLEEESASTYTDKDINLLEELALIVLLPEGKSFKGYRLWNYLDGAENSKVPYRAQSSFYPDQNGRFIYWSISDRRPNYHYKVTWNW